MHAELTLRTVLQSLPKDRLVQVGQHFNVGVPEHATRDAQVALLERSRQLGLQKLLEWLGRDELRRLCERLGLPSRERSRAALAVRLLEHAGAADSAPAAAVFGARPFNPLAPSVGAIVRVRQRQYLVEGVTPPPEPGQATRVDLVCLDDDAQGRPLSVLWELELGARVQKPETEGLGSVTRLDSPRHFAAYLNALKWNQVTATDPSLFQSPFRAGIKLFDYQLTPLRKALELPRANLFIADDVGLGKTVEAGLVLSELELRQRIDFVLIVCPASITLQWRREMQVRFGQFGARGGALRRLHADHRALQGLRRAPGPRGCSGRQGPAKLPRRAPLAGRARPTGVQRKAASALPHGQQRLLLTGGERALDPREGPRPREGSEFAETVAVSRRRA